MVYLMKNIQGKVSIKSNINIVNFVWHYGTDAYTNVDIFIEGEIVLNARIKISQLIAL